MEREKSGRIQHSFPSPIKKRDNVVVVMDVELYARILQIYSYKHHRDTIQIHSLNMRHIRDTCRVCTQQ